MTGSLGPAGRGLETIGCCPTKNRKLVLSCAGWSATPLLDRVHMAPLAGPDAHTLLGAIRVHPPMQEVEVFPLDNDDMPVNVRRPVPLEEELIFAPVWQGMSLLGRMEPDVTWGQGLDSDSLLYHLYDCDAAMRAFEKRASTSAGLLTLRSRLGDVCIVARGAVGQLGCGGGAVVDMDVDADEGHAYVYRPHPAPVTYGEVIEMHSWLCGLVAGEGWLPG